VRGAVCRGRSRRPSAYRCRAPAEAWRGRRADYPPSRRRRRRRRYSSDRPPRHHGDTDAVPRGHTRGHDAATSRDAPPPPAAAAAADAGGNGDDVVGQTGEPCRTAELITMPLGQQTRVGPRKFVLDGGVGAVTMNETEPCRPRPRARDRQVKTTTKSPETETETKRLASRPKF